MERLQRFINISKTYILGDSPLVLLTALQSSFEPDPLSSHYVVEQGPRINTAGVYAQNHQGGPIRVYTLLDTQLMFAEFFAKLELMNRTRSESPRWEDSPFTGHFQSSSTVL